MLSGILCKNKYRLNAIKKTIISQIVELKIKEKEEVCYPASAILISNNLAIMNILFCFYKKPLKKTCIRQIASAISYFFC